MGVSFNGHAGAIDWIQSRFKKGKPATLYFDEIRTPAYTDCLNRLYERVLANELAGPPNVTFAPIETEPAPVTGPFTVRTPEKPSVEPAPRA